MPLNKQSGNMYPWVTHTWNPIRGKCEHDCYYCYMKSLFGAFDRKVRLEKSELKTDLGKANCIFVGSATDMFGKWVNDQWILEVLNYCKKFDNTYLFQSKNPNRFFDFRYDFPQDTILGATIESNREYNYSKAPSIKNRIESMKAISSLEVFNVMISIEPILDFDLHDFIQIIREIHPKFVSIGADSKNKALIEPNPEKIRNLISEIEQFTDVKTKSNLNRLGVKK